MKESWESYKNILVGALGGLIIAILILIIGFFKTVLLLLFTLLGGLIGWTITNTELGNYLPIRKKIKTKLSIKERNR